MEPTFVDLEAFDVLGLSGRFTPTTTHEIPALWDRFVADWTRAGRPVPDVSYGVCFDDPDAAMPQSAPFTYVAAFPAGDADTDADAEGLERHRVPANHYAVFTHRGEVSGIERTYQAIMRDWLPASGYRRGSGPDFERYDARFDPETMTGEVDIYLPVTRDPA